jgi:nucleotide-binding universal stress UspA family protein
MAHTLLPYKNSIQGSAMKTSKIKRKIFWAIDPAQKPEESAHLVKEIKFWANRLNCDVQPVSIFSKSILNIPADLVFPWKESFQDMAHLFLDRYLKFAEANEFLPPEIIFETVTSNRKAALIFAKHAEQKNAFMIFANTRCQKSWNPWRLGSFTETLLVNSRIPMLLMNPKSKPTTKIANVLFPTDFSPGAKQALVKLEPWLQAFHSNVILFNQIETTFIYAADFNGSTNFVDLEPILRDLENSRRKKAKVWSARLRKKKIQSQIIVDRQKEFLGNQIVDIAKKENVDLIAFANRSGRMAQAMLGSVAKDILLLATCPVLVFYFSETQMAKSESVSRSPVAPSLAR